MKPSLASVAMLASTLLLPAEPARAGEQSVDLRSNGSYQSYRLPSDVESVDLAQQYSGRCRFGRSWGYDLTGRELWVNDGCSARFTVRTRDGSSHSNAAGAAVAVAAIAGLALLAHHNSRDRDDDNRDPDYGQPSYPSWGGSAIRGMNGLCLDVAGGLREGSELIVYSCNGGDNQRFSWGRRGELRVGNYCVDVADQNTNDGARLIAYTCNGGRNQRWSARGGQIVSEMTGKCLDVEGGRARSGQSVIAYRCNGGSNQRWSW